MDVGDRKVGTPFYAGMSYPRNHDGGYVTLRSAHANVESGADVAEVELLICTLRSDASVGAIGGYDGDAIYDDCLSLDPIDGQRLDLHYSPMRQQVVMKVTLTQPGTITIPDITLDYSSGWQSGSQRTGGKIVVSSHHIKN